MSSSTTEKRSALQEEGVALCLSCGLCCQGILHSYAGLEEEELGLAEELRLPVIDKDDRSAFRLPCPRYRDHKCSVYPKRPRVCGSYQCALLKGLLQGRLSFEACTTVVSEAQKLIREITEHMGTPSQTRSLWDEIRDFFGQHCEADQPEAFRREHATFLLNVKRLALLCSRFETKNFEPWTERRVL